MTATKLFPSGAWEISDIVRGYLMRRVYYGYTKREALRLFRVDVRDENKHDAGLIRHKA